MTLIDDDLLNRIRSNISFESASFPKDRQADARVFKDEVVEFYREFFRILISFHSSAADELHKKTIELVLLQDVRGVYVVSSSLPFFRDTDFILDSIRKQPNLGYAIILNYMQAAIESSSAVNREEFLHRLTHPITLNCALRLSALDPNIEKYTILYSKTDAYISDRLAKDAEFERRSLSAFEDISKSSDIMMKNIKGEFEGFLADRRLELNSMSAAMLEMKRLDDADNVWRKKRNRHLIVAWGGWSVLVLLMFAFILFVLLNYPMFKSEIIEPLKGQNSYSLLPIFLIPVIGIGWVLRMFARVVGSSFVLADDAAQRSALLSTYYRLVSDKDAKMLPGDRILVLNALFRPLPGHQNEDINPPTFADVVGDLIKGGKDR